MIKRKGILTVIMLALLMAVFSISVYAADITIEYYNGSSIDTSANGGVQTIQVGQSVTMPKKTVAQGKSANWYTNDGRAYSAGDTVTFYESVKLYFVEAYDVDNVEDLQAHLGVWQGWRNVRLTSDLEVSSTLKDINWSQPKLLLNGHTITFTDNVKTAFSGQRGGIQIYGSGTVNLLTKGDDITFSYMSSHFYAGDCGMMTIGRDVYVNAPHARLVHDPSAEFQGHPYARIFGTVNVKNLISTSSNNNFKPRVEINEQATVYLNGPTITRTSIKNTLNIIVNGGTINCLSASDPFFADGYTTFMIRGGSFNFAVASDLDKLNELLAETDLTTIKKTVNNKEYTVVVPKECDHNYVAEVIVNSGCTTFTYEHLVCSECEDKIVMSYGERSPHSWYVVEHKDPTKVTDGYDKYACQTCYHTYYDYITYDPRNLSVSIIVKTSGGEKTVETTLGQVYEITSPTKAEYVVVGIKSFGNYSVESIYGISIPWGITSINLTDANSYVGIITFEDGCSLTVTSLKGLSGLHTINYNRASVRFSSGCAPSGLKSINSLKAGATITYDASSFKDVPALTEMKMLAGCVYSFGANSFQNTGFTKLSFPDNSVPQFTGQQAFYGCTNLKELYIGKGITQLNNKPFDCCGGLELVVLMDVVSISDYTFCSNSSGVNVEKGVLKFYSHSTLGVNIGGNAFANRNTHGVVAYMASSSRTSFDNCKYELHYGIPHSYTLTKFEPTCTEEGANAYITDCPCGDNKSAIYKFYKKGVSDYVIVEMITEKIPMVPHVYENVGKLEYPNGFDKAGIMARKCTMCHGLEENDTDVFPMVEFTGYSVSITGSFGITAGFRLDSNLIKQYEECNNTKVEFGMVMASKKVLDGTVPLKPNGDVTSSKVFKLDMSATGQYDSCIKLTNMQTSMLNTELVISGFMKCGGEIVYLQGNGNAQKPNTVTFNKIKNLYN